MPMSPFPSVTRAQYVLSVLNAAPNGSTADAILRFDTTTVLEASGSHMLATTSAADGTVVDVWDPGIYLCAFHMPVLASQTVLLGISVNATGAGLTGDPVAGTLGVLASQLLITPAANAIGANLMYAACISKTQITAGIAAGQRGAAIRFHATNNAGAAGGAAFLAATARCTITRLIGLA
jgi:hypothetical protein